MKNKTAFFTHVCEYREPTERMKLNVIMLGNYFAHIVARSRFNVLILQAVTILSDKTAFACPVCAAVTVYYTSLRLTIKRKFVILECLQYLSDSLGFCVIRVSHPVSEIDHVEIYQTLTWPFKTKQSDQKETEIRVSIKLWDPDQEAYKQKDFHQTDMLNEVTNVIDIVV